MKKYPNNQSHNSVLPVHHERVNNQYDMLIVFLKKDMHTCIHAYLHMIITVERGMFSWTKASQTVRDNQHVNVINCI